MVLKNLLKINEDYAIKKAFVNIETPVVIH